MKNNQVFIIAEAGVNHNGNVEMAKRLIDEAAKAGVDCVKFQTWITEEIIDMDAPKAEYQIKNDESATQYDMLKKLELKFEDFRDLKKYAEQVGILFLSTPDESTSLRFLVDELDMPIIKVGSGEIDNIPYLRQIGAKRRNVILSTGMSTLEEARKAYDTLRNAGAPEVSVLHCTSNYPAPFDSLNLKAIHTLQREFPEATIGYSDHSEGVEASVAAVALGARIIEKHFTLDKSLPGPDHIASLDPFELSELVRQVRNVEMAISGSGEKKPHQSELQTRQVITKGVYTKQKLAAGTIITDDVVTTKRPVNGIPASEYDLVVGRRIIRDLESGAAIKWQDLEQTQSE